MATSTRTPHLPWTGDATKVAPKDARALTREFFRRMATLEEGTSEYQYTRNTLIEMNVSLVRYTARRFRRPDRSETEDVRQVGTIGLIKAIDRFDLSREVEFASFAVPYIAGEIKRYFRDGTWAVHVPRQLQERRIDLSRAREQLGTALAREATVGELAERLGLSENEIIDGQVAANGYIAGSLDAPAEPGAPGRRNGRTSGGSYADTVGGGDPGMERVEDLQALAAGLGRLDERARRIIRMRFGREMTQAQIGTVLGVSQMHVSRLLTRALAELRTDMLAEQ
ncbi:SigB/SigF/SigG family RNA polymerase sigma factor [Streptomyces sp. NPDC057137]|uniref:SigB/SigF/SigG family RNA polymerase sigma factor n=1 Tax=Streptomyces sp. NPDC057137 TaxID=3346030 RepID=UPI0036414D94